MPFLADEGIVATNFIFDVIMGWFVYLNVRARSSRTMGLFHCRLWFVLYYKNKIFTYGSNERGHGFSLAGLYFLNTKLDGPDSFGPGHIDQLMPGFYLPSYGSRSKKEILLVGIPPGLAVNLPFLSQLRGILSRISSYFLYTSFDGTWTWYPGRQRRLDFYEMCGGHRRSMEFPVYTAPPRRSGSFAGAPSSAYKRIIGIAVRGHYQIWWIPLFAILLPIHRKRWIQI